MRGKGLAGAIALGSRGSWKRQQIHDDKEDRWDSSRGATSRQVARPANDGRPQSDWLGDKKKVILSTSWQSAQGSI